jgi:hypothetical protein
MLESAVNHGANQLGLQDKIAKVRSMHTNIMSLLNILGLFLLGFLDSFIFLVVDELIFVSGGHSKWCVVGVIYNKL